MDKILVICGPTASGKTSLAIECAKLLNTEIISADSLCIYKDLNIGTAKPTELEKKEIKHHLIDIANFNDNFTVSDYREKALSVINSLHKIGKIPIICGGTGFYINSILYDLSYGNCDKNDEVRNYYEVLAREKGNEFIYNILKEKDPESALKLHFNDRKRVIRALEIFANGNKKSEILDEYKLKFNAHIFEIDYPREELYKRIDVRVNQMIELGLIDEVKSLMDRGADSSYQCMQGIGYKEFFDYFSGKESLDNTIDKIKLNTRHYAKRQITFFKKMPNLILLKPDDVKKLAKEIIKKL